MRHLRHQWVPWQYAWRSYWWRYCPECGTRQEKFTDISWRRHTYRGYYGPDCQNLPRLLWRHS